MTKQLHTQVIDLSSRGYVMLRLVIAMETSHQILSTMAAEKKKQQTNLSCCWPDTGPLRVSPMATLQRVHCIETQTDARGSRLLCKAIVLKTLHCALEYNSVWRDDHQESNYCENVVLAMFKGKLTTFHVFRRQLCRRESGEGIRGCSFTWSTRQTPPADLLESCHWLAEKNNTAMARV